MANHAHVITKKKMTPEKITLLIDRLNGTMFRGLLKTVYTDCTGQTGCWGKHVWQITVKGGEFEREGNVYHRYGSRVCWLNSSRHFEIRHGGGGSWIWWIDSAICNEIALEFDGYVMDDSDGEKEPGVKDEYADFDAYLIRSNIDSSFSDEVKARKMKFIKSKFIQENIPPVFRWKKTGKRSVTESDSCDSLDPDVLEII
jgi:hypothetical protein